MEASTAAHVIRITHGIHGVKEIESGKNKTHRRLSADAICRVVVCKHNKFEFLEY